MATTQGSKALYSDVKNWYTVFNNLASNYSNGITTLTVPSSGAKITATQINNLHDKIDAFRNDYYLGTVSSYWPQGTDATKGEKITPTGISSILATISNASKVVCKNLATNLSGAYPNGNHSSGTCSSQCSPYGSCTSGGNSGQTGYYNSCPRGLNSNTPKTNGDYSCGTTILVTCTQSTVTA